MLPEDFVHLHIHSEYSLLDGSIRIKKLLKELIKCGAKAAALTDHDAMHGFLEFYLEAQKKELYSDPKAAKLKTIAGYEANVRCFTPNLKNKTRHLVFLAETDQGYKNLIKICSLANTVNKNLGSIEATAITWQNIREHKQGLICLTSNLEGELSTLLSANLLDEAKNYLLNLIEIFGKNHVFVELSDNNLPEQKKLIPILAQLAADLELEIVATANVHYLKASDQETHLSLLAIKRKLARSSLKEVNLSYEFHLATFAEMENKFANYPQALENTSKIAARCNINIDLKSIFMPDFRVKPEECADDCLVRLAKEGLLARKPTITRYLGDNFNEEIWGQYEARLEYEISVILKMKFSGYFLIVQDFINWAKERDIPVGPGRGSAAGSLVTYALRITNIDPIRFNLLFERFLNPERISMPDIDTDFCQDRRGEVLNYVYQKYGNKAVAQIVTFGRLKAKNALKNLARILDWSFKDSNEFAKLIPNAPDITLEQALKTEVKLQERLAADERSKILWDGALELEGIVNSLGIHAAGVIISDSALDERCPLMESEGQLLTQFEHKFSEKIGLIKFDFLGLKTLTVIDNAVKLVKIVKDPTFDIELIDIEDEKVFQMLSAAHLTGVFQLESTGMRKLISELKPTCFSDVVAVLALFRPGPLESGMVTDFVSRKHGQTSVEYPFPELEPILNDTYGVIVYQEQVQKIAVVLANYSLGEADLLRRAMGKKDKVEMEKQKARFVSGAEALGHNAEKVSDLFDLLAKFAEYGFNKSHSAAYAYVTVQTAFLKTYFPTEFMAAIMSIDLDNTDKIITYVEDCKRMKIVLLPPSINHSCFDFVIENRDKIRFGLGAIKGLGRGIVDVLVAERKKNGQFLSIPDFIARCDAKKLNKKTMESLIRAGALDDIATNRAELMANIDAWVKTVAKESERSEQIGEGIFGLANEDTPQKGNAKIVAKTPSKPDLGTQKIERSILSLQKKYGCYFPLTLETTALATNPKIAKLLMSIQIKRSKPWSLQEQIAGEMATLGFAMSIHPALNIKDDIEAFSEFALKDAFRHVEDTPAHEQKRRPKSSKIAGIVTMALEKKNKDGELYAVYKIEDATDSIEVSLFSKQYLALARKIMVGDAVWVECNLKKGLAYNTARATCVAIGLLSDKRKEHVKEITLLIKEDIIKEASIVKEIKKILTNNAGQTPVFFDIILPKEKTRLKFSMGKINPSDTFFCAIENILPGEIFIHRNYKARAAT